MQISEAWLRDYTNPAISTEELVEQLTMAGLEVDSVTPAAAEFDGVVIAEVLSMQQHPDADRLRVCQVSVGAAEALQIVCGASNVRVGLKIPAALIGAVLPGDFKIKKSKLRGVESCGMLCSEKELGLAADSSGLMELPADAPVGKSIRDYLSLSDNIIEVDLTPNRADCLSVEGVAREMAALNKMAFTELAVTPTPITHEQSLQVQVEVSEACPRYLGRLITHVNPKAQTPLWMQERLRRSGMRSLGPLVDVTNYVLIELGQPLHAFDADKLSGKIQVRWSSANENLSLLNGQNIQLDADSLVIADEKQALALAGIMGGNDSAVSDDTQNIFLECAFFSPQSIAGRARRYGLHTDSSHRFERGVSPDLQWRALERASQLILNIAGGNAGPITSACSEELLPQRNAVLLRRLRIKKILALSLPDHDIQNLFERLGMVVEPHVEGWLITPPGFRFDIAIEADLLEELARLYGYNQLPSNTLLLRSTLALAPESVMPLDRVKDLLVDRGYQEAITYSFVDEDIQKAIAPNMQYIPITNPISTELSVMRTTLWCGLIKAALYNLDHQQTRVRFFETGLRFIQLDGQTQQLKCLSGLVLGSAFNEQWAEKVRKVDFYDVKADLEALFALSNSQIRFMAAQQAALHPGQTAELLTTEGQHLGWLGMLHPVLEKQLGFETPVYLFELDQDLLLAKNMPIFKTLSKYPPVRRDLALIVKQEIAAQDLVDGIKQSVGDSLQQVVIFDVYRGQGIEEGCKSVALSIELQDFSQTLTDSIIDAIFNKLLETLANKFSAKLRD
ncbi:MAG: phenylalanine--tRNA ligase subunit beta [Methylococcaceae bacterium]|jgi:phenylalanyl-tRNA synthetase beta chain